MFNNINMQKLGNAKKCSDLKLQNKTKKIWHISLLLLTLSYVYVTIFQTHYAG